MKFKDSLYSRSAREKINKLYSRGSKLKWGSLGVFGIGLLGILIGVRHESVACGAEQVIDQIDNLEWHPKNEQDDDANNEKEGES